MILVGRVYFQLQIIQGVCVEEGVCLNVEQYFIIRVTFASWCLVSAEGIGIVFILGILGVLGIVLGIFYNQKEFFMVVKSICFFVLSKYQVSEEVILNFLVRYL